MDRHDRPLDGERSADAQFRAVILDGRFPCLGASSAVRRGDYLLRVYPPLGTAVAADRCTRDLAELIHRFPVDRCPVAILVAVFDGPRDTDERRFEDLLWNHLRSVRERGKHVDHGTSPPAGREVGDPGFAFGGRDFFIVGMHPDASRAGRRFRWPTLVFNALTHSEKLRDEGHYELMRDRIRARDLRLQGTPNPNLDLHQLAQFSGRDVGTDWQCPLPQDVLE